MENGKARQLHLRDGREVGDHRAVARRRRCASKGFTVISGLAWSGRGKIARVDVSLDGGSNWRAARIDGLGSGQGAARASTPRPNGTAARCCCNRAIDETGYVQPTKTELRKMRGVNSIYHNNGIQTWLVKARWRGRECRSVLRPRFVVLVALAGARRSAAEPQARHRPRRDAGRDRRLGHRRAAGRAGAAARLRAR